MSKLQKEVGCRIGNLVLTSVSISTPSLGYARCDCGKQIVVSSRHWGSIKSCGCIPHKESFKHLNRSKDMTGQRFGQWLVMSRAENTASGSARWLCKCSCGKEQVVSGDTLRLGTSKSCGCFQQSFEYTQKEAVDLTGKRFDRLVVIGLVSGKTGKGAYWECKCDCGKVVKSRAGTLTTGGRTSCGCKRVERLQSMTGPLNNLWNPNLTDKERREQRDGAMLGHWRKSVLSVFGPACVICQSFADPHAHHIESWKSHKEKRFDTDNGVVLCAACHKQFHSEHYRKDAGLVELMAFMEKKLCGEPRYVAA